MSLPKLGDISAQQLINFATPKHWGIKDPARLRALVEEAKSLVTPGRFLSDNLFSSRRCGSLPRG